MFRFSIRELMLVTLVAALAVAWWVEHRDREQRVREAVERVYEVLDSRAAALNPPKK